MSFGDNLRALIEERDITQKELAKKLNNLRHLHWGVMSRMCVNLILPH